jgi:uncharacterized membrane protein YhhN
MLSSVNFLFSNCLYIGAAIAFNIGRPFKKPFYSNPFYLFNIIILIYFNWLMTNYEFYRFEVFEFFEGIPDSYYL